MPAATILGPASFTGGVQSTGHAFSLAYVNPPFDHELGGGKREEYTFVTQATKLLMGGGTLVLVCPNSAIFGNKDFCDFIDSRYEEVRIWKFPDALRRYNEIVVIGTKRKVEIGVDALDRFGYLRKTELRWRTYTPVHEFAAIGTPHRPMSKGRWETEESGLAVYHAHWSHRPHTFKKCGYCEGELEKAISESPLNRLLNEVPPMVLRRPPLPLNKGHIAMMLASGMLDGVVRDGDDTHVVRGTTSKIEYMAERSSEEKDDGSVSEKVRFSERICLVIRFAGSNGNIVTLTDEPVDNEDGFEECDDEECVA
jgi:hypothetical protein